MTGVSSSAAEILSPPEVAVGGGRFARATLALRKLFHGDKYEAVIQDIQKAFGVSWRTAERIYVGRAGSDDTTLAVLTTDKFGGALLEEALRRVPVERRAAVARHLGDTAELVRLRAEQEDLAARIAARIR